MPKNRLSFRSEGLLLGGGATVPFSEEQSARVQAVVRGKIAGGNGCSLCGNRHFNIGTDLVHLILQPDASKTEIAGTALPCLPVTCSKCGEVYLLNVFVLGVAEILNVIPSAATKAGV
jgi:hypothetical protein